MALPLESGVRQNETGYRCPDIHRLNFLPFAAEESLDPLINVTGGTGPIVRLDNHQQINQLSGVLGGGSFYPGSGTMEQLSRLFWCVKAWSLQVSVTMQVPGLPSVWQNQSDNFLANGKVPNTFKTCFIQNDFDSKILHLQDIFASGTFVDETQPLSSPGNVAQLHSHAIPLDPIMTWQDLMCRNKYFSWAPPPRLQTGFYTLPDPRTEINSPYIMRFSMQGDNSDPFDPTIYPTAYGMWNLSIMNSDFICRDKAAMTQTGQLGCYTPTGFDDIGYGLAPQNYSGALINDSGQITGYGFHPLISGCPPVLAYRRSYDPRDPIASGLQFTGFSPSGNMNYFPMIYFMLRMRSFPINSNNAQCGFAADVCSLQPQSGWFTAGSFVIYDDNITGYIGTSPAARAQKEIFRCPLYAPNATSNLIVTVTLTPNQYWINQVPGSSGTVNW